MDSQLFKHPTFGEIRAAGTPDQPEFCVQDVCTALGYTNSRKALSDHVDDPDVTKRYVWVQTGVKADGTPAMRETEMSFVNESGLYALIFGSTLDTAKEFKRWVTSEVLPSIRKQGGYMMAQAEDTPEQIMARALKIAYDTLDTQKVKIQDLEEKVKELQEENSRLTPALYPFELIYGDKWTMAEAAKMFGFKDVYKFCAWMMQQHIVERLANHRLYPTKRYLHKGIFAHSHRSKIDAEGEEEKYDYIYLTERGVALLRSKIANEGGDIGL